MERRCDSITAGAGLCVNVAVRCKHSGEIVAKSLRHILKSFCATDGTAVKLTALLGTGRSSHSGLTPSVRLGYYVTAGGTGLGMYVSARCKGIGIAVTGSCESLSLFSTANGTDAKLTAVLGAGGRSHGGLTPFVCLGYYVTAGGTGLGMCDVTGCERVGIAVTGGCESLGLLCSADGTYKFLCAVNGASGRGASRRLPGMWNVLDDDEAYGTVSAMYATVRRISIVESVAKRRQGLGLLSTAGGTGIKHTSLLGAVRSVNCRITPGMLTRK